MQENQPSPARFSGCLAEIVVMLLTAGVCLAISSGYRNFGDELYCQGRLGAGFPVSFLCDYGTGGSPIDSWGRIDLADFPYFSPRGLAMDLLFYVSILSIAWLVRRPFSNLHFIPRTAYIWLALIGCAFLLGFALAAVAYKAERVNFHDYLLGIPSPIPATPTPIGTPPALDTPFPTVGP